MAKLKKFEEEGVLELQEMNKSFGQQSRMLKENLRSGMIELGTEIGEKLLPPTRLDFILIGISFK